VGQSITYICNISSTDWFVLLVWPLVWGWYVVLKLSWVSISLNKVFQKLKVTFVSMFEMIFLGKPCILKISFMKISTMFMALWVDFTVIKCASLKSLYTTTIIESFCFLVIVNHVMKSILITSDFHSGMDIGYNNPAGWWCSTLTSWNSRHLSKYLTTSVFILDQKYSFNSIKFFW